MIFEKNTFELVSRIECFKRRGEINFLLMTKQENKTWIINYISTNEKQQQQINL